MSQVFAFTAGSLGDILATAGLVAKIVKALYDNRHTSHECEELAIELKSLQSVLLFTDHAIQQYRSSPLGEPLFHFIQPEVVQCHLSLSGFLDRINACRQGLSFTTIASLWHRVVWAASNEAASLSAKLQNHRMKLIMLLVSLNSVSLMELENRDRRFYTTFRESLAGFHNNPLSVRRIPENILEVVDHLGDKIPISTLFCTTWDSFHYVLRGYCRNRIGEHYVGRGDYEVVQPGTNQVIKRPEFPRAVEDGGVLELSIILFRQEVQDERKCPRCSYRNPDAPSDQDGGWIRCSHCSGHFKSTTDSEAFPSTDGIAHSDNAAEAKEDADGQLNRPMAKLSVALETLFFRRITMAMSMQNATSDHEPNNDCFEDTVNPVEQTPGSYHPGPALSGLPGTVTPFIPPLGTPRTPGTPTSVYPPMGAYTPFVSGLGWPGTSTPISGPPGISVDYTGYPIFAGQ